MIFKAIQDSVEKELSEQKARLESIWRQKSRETWLLEGYRNIKLLHSSTTIKRRRNKIDCIKNGDIWLQDREQIGHYFKEGFTDLYTSSNPTFMSELEELGERLITNENNAKLTKIPSNEEIRKIV